MHVARTEREILPGRQRVKIVRCQTSEPGGGRIAEEMAKGTSECFRRKCFTIARNVDSPSELTPPTRDDYVVLGTDMLRGLMACVQWGVI